MPTTLVGQLRQQLQQERVKIQSATFTMAVIISCHLLVNSVNLGLTGIINQSIDKLINQLQYWKRATLH